jgi:hypothetical protein
MAQIVDQELQLRAQASPPKVAGGLKIHPLKSRVFGNKRMLRVWLPPGYAEVRSRKRLYPVFYLNDGQNLFDPTTAFGGIEWQVDETAQRLIQERRIEPLIIVGIDNAQENRIREYVPYRSPDIPVRIVAGKKYPEFLFDRPGRIFTGRTHQPVYRNRAASTLWTTSGREPFIVCRRGKDIAREYAREELAGTSVSRRGYEGTW